jgi:hypothetical protein
MVYIVENERFDVFAVWLKRRNENAATLSVCMFFYHHTEMMPCLHPAPVSWPA